MADKIKRDREIHRMRAMRTRREQQRAVRRLQAIEWPDSWSEALIMLAAELAPPAVACQHCGFMATLDRDAIIAEPDGDRAAPLALCSNCAKAIHEAFRQAFRDIGLCIHGTTAGRRCEECGGLAQLPGD